MRQLLKILVFSLVVIGFYTAYSNTIPLKPEPPPPEEAAMTSFASLDQLVAFGKEIYHGKGTCTLCHNPVLKGRAPEMDNLHVVSEQRIKEPGYKGKAKTGEEYLREALIEPSAHVVPGFGVKGTADKVSPMPDVRTGSIGLSTVEVEAVVAFLQAKEGGQVTVKLPTEAPPPATAPAAGAPAAPAKTGEAVLAKHACGSCHKIGKEQGEIGPSLIGIGKQGEAYLRRAILQPDADIPKGYAPGLMPGDYGDKMTAGELELLIQLLKKS